MIFEGKRMRLYFARHGQSEANTQHIISNRDVPLGLTILGKGQALVLAKKLKGMGIAAIFCSPVFRARQTAIVVSNLLGVPYQITEALREYDCGVLEDQSDEESWRLHRHYFEEWTLRGQYSSKPDGGECFLDIQERFLPFIENLTSNDTYNDSDILLIGHGGLFLLMLPLILSNVDHEFAVSHGIGNAEYVLAERRKSEWVCLQWGDEIVHPGGDTN
jgi:broad specificity phosphatase PhoE